MSQKLRSILISPVSGVMLLTSLALSLLLVAYVEPVAQATSAPSTLHTLQPRGQASFLTNVLAQSGGITITDAGFVPAVFTITVGTEVTWYNATNQTLTLQSGQPSLIYLPLIMRNALSTVSSQAAAEPVKPTISRADGDSFTVVLSPGATFSHIFTTIGDHPFFLIERPFFPGLIFVLRGGDVHGFIYAEIGDKEVGQKLGQIFLPDIGVYLRNVGTGQLSPEVKTDLHGRFIIPHPVVGKYEICWKAPGWFPGCSPNQVSLNTVTAYPLPIAIVPERFVIAGHVTLADGTACRMLDTFFGTDAHTTVALLDGNGADVVPPVRANVFGDYVLSQAPIGNWRVRADCESATAEQAIVVGTTGNVVNLTLGNSRPTLKTVVATLGGQGVRLVAPGETVQVTAIATDPDGDPLHYKWATASPGFVSVDAPTVNWTLPNLKGAHKLYVQVRDDEGGYHVRTLTLSTDQGILFSGTVRGNDGPLIANASVNINGKTTTTNADGYFTLLVPQESPRYIVTIEKEGYALFSKIYYEGITGGKFRLHRAYHEVVDPTGPIVVVEKGVTGQESGTQLQIPANALVDANGQLATSLLNLYLKTVNFDDPDNSFPGDDYAGRNAVGTEVGIVSYGAVDIQIKDAAGNPYNLAAGANAQVSIPVHPAQLAAGPPPTIPYWWYNQQTGVWQEEGVAQLQGNFYVADVSHFSTLNMDVEFSNAACMRILIDETRLTRPVNLRVTVPTGTGVDKVKTTILNDALSVIVRLPANTPITLNVLDSAGNVIALGTQVVNSGPGIGSAPTDIPYPYTVCNSEATLTLGLPTDPPFAPPAGEYHFLIREGIDDATSTAAYYAAIDPTNSKTTFNAWKTANGMAVDPDANNDGNNFNDDAATAEVSAAYTNAGDLGFGRAMHAKKVGSNLAFYVCNYPTVDEARLDINLIACVAMDYSPVPPGVTPFTKFYVFNAAGNRVASANLDERGEKFVPGLCMACHGGSYNPAESVAAGGGLPSRNRFQVSPPGNPNQGSQFLPFDLDAFEYSGIVGFRRADQQAKFKTLNQRVADTSPLASITDLTTNWYAGGSTTQITSHVPAGWTATTAQANLYSQVVKPSCRTCHVAQDGAINWLQHSDFDTYSGFIKTLICTQRVMPHAKVTFERFWLSQSPNQPAVLGAAGLSGWAVTDPCPP